jgi:hypothetical protein
MEANQISREGRDMADQLSVQEAEIARKIQDEVERRIKSKYAVIAVAISLILGGGGFWIARETTNELVNQSKLNVSLATDEVNNLKQRAARVENEIDERFKQLDRVRLRSEEAARNADLADSRMNTVSNNVEVLQNAVLDLTATVKKTSSPDVAPKADNISQKIKQANERSKNLQFIIYPHYRKESSESQDFVEKVKNVLSSKGYAVAGATGDSSIQPQKTDINVGPHVSYFTDPKDPEGSKKAKEVAEDIAKTLTTARPTGYGEFTAKDHPDRPDQLRLFGVWF